MSTFGQNPAITYRVSWPEPSTHYFHVEMRIDPAPEAELDLRMPAWRPGRYVLQEFARNVIRFSASAADGAPLPFRKLDKSTWRIQTGGEKVVIATYRVYCFVLDAGNSYLTEEEAYLNPITLLMYVPGRELEPTTLALERPAHWKIATALETSLTTDILVAGSYHDLVDSPIVVSPTLNVLSFDESGVRYEIAIQGNGNYDADTIVEDFRKIVRVQAAMMGVVPFDRYVFLFHLVNKRIGHGVEHKNSTSIVIGGSIDFTDRRQYLRVLGVTAHEFFHAWNVERVRPEAIYHPDYASEQYTSTMWWYEGVTSYFDTITLVRAGLIDEQEFRRRLASVIQRFDQEPGRQVTTVAMTSWDSWIKSSDPPPHTYYSFYTAGEVLGFLLDLEIRGRTGNKKSIDDVMRYLYHEYAAQSRGVPEDGLERAFESVSGTSFQEFFDAYVYGTTEIDYDRFLMHAGLRLEISDVSRDQAFLGITHREGSGGLELQSVFPDSPAAAAGLDVGDILLAFDGKQVTGSTLTRILRDYRPGDIASVTAFRDGRLWEFSVELGQTRPSRYTLVPTEDRESSEEELWRDLIWQRSPQR